MPVTDKKILIRLNVVAILMVVFAAAVVFKLVSIQLVDGERYLALAETRTTKTFTIAPNRGNLYSDDGSLLATSVSKYTVRWDAVTVSDKHFRELHKPLAAALSKQFGKPKSHYLQLLRKAKVHKNRYALIARNLDYSDYIAVKSFPLFEKGLLKVVSLLSSRPSGSIP